MRAHPASGAGSIHFDGSDEHTLMEIKDAAKSYTLSRLYIHRLWKTAIHQQKNPILVVQFPDYELTININKRTNR